MYFPISGAQISPIYLAVVGFIIGILGGFFGVGGSFIAGPALRLVGLDWDFCGGCWWVWLQFWRAPLCPHLLPVSGGGPGAPPAPGELCGNPPPPEKSQSK